MIEREVPQIVVKGLQGHPVKFKETRHVKAMRANLKTINKRLGSTSLSLPLTEDEREKLIDRLLNGRRFKSSDDHRYDERPMTLPGRSLYRVFNRNHIDHGGRFYGHWVQGLPKSYRKRLKMDGSKVTELDFKSMAISLLYLREDTDDLKAIHTC